MADENLSDQLDHLAWLKLRAKRSKLVYEERKRQADEYEAQMFVNMQEQRCYGHRSQRWRYEPHTTKYAQVTDRESFHAWCAENGLEEVYFEPKEARARLNELVRDLTDSKQPLPPGLDVRYDNYISTTEIK